MIYNMSGTKRSTGETIKVRVEAASLELAIASAEKHGVTVDPNSVSSEPITEVTAEVGAGSTSPEASNERGPSSLQIIFVTSVSAVCGAAAVVLVLFALGLIGTSRSQALAGPETTVSPSEATAAAAPPTAPTGETVAKEAMQELKRIQAEQARAEQAKAEQARVEAAKAEALRAEQAREEAQRKQKLLAKVQATSAYWEAVRTQVGKLSDLPKGKAAEARALRRMMGEIRGLSNLNVDSEAVAVGNEWISVLRRIAEIDEYMGSDQWMVDCMANGAKGDPGWPVREAKRLQDSVQNLYNAAVDASATGRSRLAERYSTDFSPLP